MRRAALVTAVVVALAGTVAVLACGNTGVDRLLSVSTAGIVKGLIYFDMDGNRSPTAGDDSVKNMRVRLVAKNSGDPVASALSLVSGLYRMDSVPVGTYLVVVDTTPLADTAVVIKLDSTEITVKPGDSTFVAVGISYPHVSVARARSNAIPLGRKVFLEGVSLNALNTFRDSTVYLQDTSAAIRAARVRTPAVLPADSVRVRGTIAVRAGQRTIEDASFFSLGPTFLPTVQTVTTAQAASAVGGTQDAQQLRVLNAPITDTATVASGDRKLTVNDGSGPLEVLLDGTADPAFRPPQLPGLYILGNRFDIIGLATPTGTVGVWRLKPRSATDTSKLP